MKPPLLSDLTGFDLGVDDSSSDFADYDAQLKKRRDQINMLDERSEGELGELDVSHESLGQIMPSNTNIVGKPLDSVKTRSRYGDQSNHMQTSQKSLHSRPANMAPQLSHKKDNRPLAQAQTLGFEGGGERSASAYDYNDFDDSTDMMPSAHKPRRKDIEKPIYDSKEDPIPRSKKKGTAGKVAMSGESFGGANPMIHSSGGVQEAIKNARRASSRGEIPEDCLEHFDDDD